MTLFKCDQGSRCWGPGNSKKTRIFKLKDTIGTRSVNYRSAMNNFAMKSKV